MNAISSKMVRIRKAHNCWGCTKILTPPAEMGVVTCSDNGKIYNVYWCDRCQKILDGDPFCAGDEFEYGELLRNI